MSIHLTQNILPTVNIISILLSDPDALGDDSVLSGKTTPRGGRHTSSRGKHEEKKPKKARPEPLDYVVEPFSEMKKFKPGRIGLLAPVRGISDIVEAFDEGAFGRRAGEGAEP